jgi:carbamoyl-phosphate synthase large subunit
MEPDRILLLGASEIQVPAIEAARRRGLHVLVADYDPLAPGLALADTPLVVSTNDVAAILSAAREHRIRGIATTSDFPVRTVAEVGVALGLPALSPLSARICTDKFLQREALAAAGLPVPWFLRIAGGVDPSGLELPSWPAIVKPVDSSASRGVSRVDDPGELAPALEEARTNSRSGDAIVEEFLEGPEFSVEVLCHGGTIDVVAITAKTTAGHSGRFFVETRHVIPAPLEPQQAESIRGMVRSAVAACGLDHSAAHAEVKLTHRGPILIEMAARLGGDFITSDLVPLSTGVDMVGSVLDIAMGREPDCVRGNQRFAGIQFVTPENHQPADQRIRRLGNDPRMVRFRISPPSPGAALRSSMDRLGHWICVASSREELLDLLDLENGATP